MPTRSAAVFVVSTIHWVVSLLRYSKLNTKFRTAHITHLNFCSFVKLHTTAHHSQYNYMQHHIKLVLGWRPCLWTYEHFYVLNYKFRKDRWSGARQLIQFSKLFSVRLRDWSMIISFSRGFPSPNFWPSMTRMDRESTWPDSQYNPSQSSNTPATESRLLIVSTEGFSLNSPG